jgi:hypothetical protein
MIVLTRIGKYYPANNDVPHPTTTMPTRSGQEESPRARIAAGRPRHSISGAARGSLHAPTQHKSATHIDKSTLTLGEPKRRRDKAPWWQDLDINALAIAKGLWEQSHTSKSSMQEPVNDLDVRKANFGEPS